MANLKREKLLRIISDGLNRIIDGSIDLRGKYEASEKKIEEWLFQESTDHEDRSINYQKLVAILLVCPDESESLGFVSLSEHLLLKGSQILKKDDCKSKTTRMEKEFEKVIKKGIDNLLLTLKGIAYKEFGESENTKNYIKDASFGELVGILYVHACAAEIFRIEKKPYFLLSNIIYTRDEIKPDMNLNQRIHYALCSERLEEIGFWEWYSNYGLPENAVTVWLDDVDPEVFISDDMIGDLVNYYVLGNEESTLFREGDMSFIPYEDNDYLTNIRLRIGADKQVFIFMKYTDGLADFLRFLQNAKAKDLPTELNFIILIPAGIKLESVADTELIRYSPKMLTKDEMRQIFWSCSKQQIRNDGADELVDNICSFAGNDKVLMGLIGEAYGQYYSQGGSDEALRLLSEIVQSQREYNKIHVSRDSEHGKAFYRYHSKITDSNKQDSFRTILQIIKNRYQGFVLDDKDRSTLLLLSCLSGYPIPPNKFQRWFDMDDNSITKYKSYGWLKETKWEVEMKRPEEVSPIRIKTEKRLYPSMPVFLIHSMYSEGEAKKEYESVFYTLDAFLKEVRNEDDTDNDPVVIFRVFQRIIRYLNRWPYMTKNRTEYEEKLYHFKIDSIKFFTENFLYNESYQLLMEMSPRERKRIETKALLAIVKHRDCEKGRQKFTENEEMDEILEICSKIGIDNHYNLSQSEAEMLFFAMDSIMDAYLWLWANKMKDVDKKEIREEFYYAPKWDWYRKCFIPYITYYGALFDNYKFGPTSGIIGQHPGYYLCKYYFFYHALELYMCPNYWNFKNVMDYYYCFISIEPILSNSGDRKECELKMFLNMDQIVVKSILSTLPITKPDYHRIIEEIYKCENEIKNLLKAYPLYLNNRLSGHMEIMEEFLDMVLQYGKSN